MRVSRTLSSDKIHLYSTLRNEIEPKVYKFLRVSAVVGGLTGVIIPITGFDFDKDISVFASYPYIIKLIFFMFVMTLFTDILLNLYYDNKTEDILSEHLLDYFHMNNTPEFDIQILEERALQSKSSSAVRIQMGVILIPASAATIVSIIVIGISIPTLITILVAVLFFFLVVNLTTEMKRLRFDDAILVAIKTLRIERTLN